VLLLVLVVVLDLFDPMPSAGQIEDEEDDEDEDDRKRQPAVHQYQGPYPSAGVPLT